MVPLAQTGALTPGAAPDPRQVLAMVFSPAVLLGFLVAFVFSLAVYGALVKAESTLARGELEISVGAALLAGLRRVPGMLLAGLLFGLAVAIGSLALLIPGIYLFVKMQLWLVAMFVEDTTAVESLKLSWRLTDKRWWRATIILSVACVLVYVVAIAAGMLGALFQLSAHVSVATGLIVRQLFSALSNILVMPLVVAIAVVMYHDFKLRSEGGDLAARVGSLGKA
jgi:hypothetical protein